jgi:hypothetical protein
MVAHLDATCGFKDPEKYKDYATARAYRDGMITGWKTGVDMLPGLVSRGEKQLEASRAADVRDNLDIAGER